jgi:protein-disulfide isomerase
MRMRVVIALAAALALAPPGAIAQHRSAARSPAHSPGPAAATNWLQHVERTAEGGYRMGNPNARLKLVEYGSVTCPHCAEFAEANDRQLRDKFVRTGRVSFEYRPFVIFPSDPGIFMLLACQAPERFFDTLDQLYATQESWRAQIGAHEQELRRLQLNAMVPLAVRATGVDALFRRQGLSQQQVDTCLADPAGLQRLMDRNHAAEALGVQGTPTFFLNGRMVDFADWAALERLLSQS